MTFRILDYSVVLIDFDDELAYGSIIAGANYS